MAACAGLHVLELSDGFTATALCGQLFAGLGAEVVKFEPPAGDPLRGAGPGPCDSSYEFHALNAGKESVTRDPSAGPAQWADLVRWSDVVLWDYVTPWPAGAGTAETFGSDWPHTVLATAGAPDLASGADAELLIEAASSLMSCTGHAERPAVSAGLPYGLHVGAFFTFAGAMAALYERERSGLGQIVSVNLEDALVALLGNFMPSYFLTGKLPSRIGNRHTIAAPWNLYPTADGAVVICAGTGGATWWDRILVPIGRTDLVGDGRYDNEAKRVARVEEVDEIVSAWTRTQPTAAVTSLMAEHNVPASAVNSLETIHADPHYSTKRAMFVDVPVGEGSVLIPGLPMKIGAWTPPLRPGPELGANNGDVRPPAAKRASPPDGASPDAHAKPLTGVKIIEFGARTSVPFAGRILAELGADVIKVEPPKGEPLRGAGQQVAGSSYLFHINNAGKKSAAIDTSQPAGKKLLLDLVAGADAFIENLAPGSLDKMRLGYADLKAVNPNIIYCSVSGYGHVSGYGTMRALDTVVQASTGVMHVTGYPDHDPVKMGISAVDLAAAIALVGSVIGGLRERMVSGSGLHVDLAMSDVAVWMSQVFWADLQTGRSPNRMGNRSAANAPHNVFEARDGGVAIAVGSDEQWKSLLALLPATALPHDAASWDAARRVRSVDAVEAAVAAWTGTRTVAEILAACGARGIPAAPMRTLGDVATDPGLLARKLIYEADHPTAGKVRLLGNPIRLSRTPPEAAGYAPTLGEHTAEVLGTTLSLSSDVIEQLRAAGTITIAGTHAAMSR